jgi:hypothetical protein
MNDDQHADPDQEARLRRALATAADRPAPADLTARVLDRPEFGRRKALSQSPARRWAVIGVAAAAVGALAIGITVVNNATRTPSSGLAGPGASTAQSAAVANDTATVTTVVPQVDPLLPRGDYQAWAHQAVPCDGADPVPDTTQQLLSPKAEVVGAVVCGSGNEPVDGDGLWLSAGHHELTAAQTAALVKALTVKNVKIDPAAMCTMQLIAVPDFTLVLADGSRVRPGVPGDGCHPSAAAADILATGADGPFTDHVRQTWTPAMMVAGCEPGGDSYDPFTGMIGTTAERPATPKGALSVCLFNSNITADNPAGVATLTSLGSTTRAAVDLALDALVKPSKQCTSDDAAATPAAGWLTVIVKPAKADGSSPSPTVYLELGGCHRVATPDGLVGFAPASAVDALAAAASEKVTLKTAG